MSEPRIYTRNYVDSQSNFVVSHSGNNSYLYDRNDLTQFVTTGANNDLTTFSLECFFIEGGVNQTRTIDTIFIKNYNLKGWSIYSWNGSVWEVKANYANDTLSTRYLVISPFSTNKILLVCDTTKTANEEKKIGELIVCNTTLDVGSDMTSYDPKWRERVKDVVLGDGSLHKVYVKDASGRLGKYEASAKFNYLSKATRDALKAIKDSGQPFLLQPESVTVPEDVYYVHWANAWDEKYMSSYKGSGYEVVMNVKEV